MIWALPEVQQVTATFMDRLGQKRQEALLDILAEIRKAIGELPDDLPAPQPRLRPERLTR